MKRLYILTLCSVIAAVTVFSFKKVQVTTIATSNGKIVPSEWLHTNNAPRTPAADVRSADQTFLTFPEWFLVFSPDEQAQYFKTNTATTFPFMAHTAQIWESYKIVNDQVKEDFPVNKGYHFMIWVIGASASVEYAIKACYETIIGRITDTYTPVTEEDKFNATFTQSYVDFIRDRPWYEYNFKKQLFALWTNVPFAGNNIFRKAERRYILTAELLVKYVYGKLIGLGTEQVYEEALPTTVVLLENDSLSYLPRYDRFMTEAIKYAEEGRSFKEIAGNTSAILVTILLSTEQHVKFQNSVTLFEQPVASNRMKKRIALVTPVSNLSPLLKQLKHDNIQVEHVFDY